jgi:S1-C subfamily serine protease
MKYLWIAGMMLFLGQCKPRVDSEFKQVSRDSQPSCPLNKGFAGRMGMQLEDADGGARIACVVTGQGIHHIGLKVGDIITALNGKARVRDSRAFETVAQEIITKKGAKHRLWQFEIYRGGSTLTISPKPAYPNCGPYVFDDCGPLLQ